MTTDDNGLYYMRVRYYNPEIRRFINQDIVTGSIENSQSLNRYAYCQGNPVNYFDPFGLEPCEFFTGLGHGMLNLMGLIPGIGDVFDITNAIWYALDGNWGRCFESGIAALPFIGNLLPDRRTCDYVRRVLNIASYGGTAVLAGQGMVDGGQALWADISSGQCSGWSIFLGVANIGLNGATLFFSGKSFASETKDLNKMLKADGVTDGLLGPLKDNGGYLNLEAFKKESDKLYWGSWDEYEHITVDGQEYAMIGDRLYSRHAVERMQPSGNLYGNNIYQASDCLSYNYGRSVAPEYVEYVLKNAEPIKQDNGNISYTLGTLQIITNIKGNVVTVMTK